MPESYFYDKYSSGWSEMASFSSVPPIDNDKETTCTLCRQTYRDPRLLPCVHSFCFDCLQKQLDDSTDQESSLLCPTCSDEIPLPLNDLPSHVYLRNQANAVRRVLELKAKGACENCNSESEICAFCPDCGDSGLRICHRCVECHKTFKSYKKHTFVSLDSDLTEFARKGSVNESTICSKHSVVFKYFCQVCEVSVCSECCVLDHFGHELKEINSAVVKKKAEIESACSVLDPALPTLSKAQGVLKDVLNEVHANTAEVKKEIEEGFVAILSAVENRKEELLGEAESMLAVKVSKLKMQQEDLERLNVALKRTIYSVQRGTQSFAAAEFLAIQPGLKKSCLTLEKQFANASLDPVTNATMVATIGITDVIMAIRSVGSVEDKLPCSPDHCSLVDINSKFPIGMAVSTPRTLIVQTHNSKGKPMESGQVRVRAWVTNQSGKKVCDAKVSNSDNGKISVTFCVWEECTGKAHFTADGKHINGSPFDIMVRFYTQVRKPVLSIKTPSKPSFVYVLRDSGDIFVTLTNGNVAIYSKQGVLRSTIAGSSLGVLDPGGIVVDEHNGIMYITCYKRCKVVMATLDGKLISSIGSLGSGHLQFYTPMGLCLDAAGNLYVADYGNKRVQVLGPDLVFKKEVRCQSETSGVAVDSLGDLYVATNAGLEKVTDKIQTCSNRGSCGDVAISPEGFKVISYEGRLEVCTPKDSLLATIRKLLLPLGVFLDQSGHIFIAEHDAKKVQKY